MNHHVQVKRQEHVLDINWTLHITHDTLDVMLINVIDDDFGNKTKNYFPTDRQAIFKNSQDLHSFHSGINGLGSSFNVKGIFFFLIQEELIKRKDILSGIIAIFAIYKKPQNTQNEEKLSMDFFRKITARRILKLRSSFMCCFMCWQTKNREYSFFLLSKDKVYMDMRLKFCQKFRTF